MIVSHRRQVAMARIFLRILRRMNKSQMKKKVIKRVKYTIIWQGGLSHSYFEKVSRDRVTRMSINKLSNWIFAFEAQLKSHKKPNKLTISRGRHSRVDIWLISIHDIKKHFHAFVGCASSSPLFRLFDTYPICGEVRRFAIAKSIHNVDITANRRVLHRLFKYSSHDALLFSTWKQVSSLHPTLLIFNSTTFTLY